jgi:2,4-dienoyl-CoA reductase-like NADH-dependent reductase (Old Yellow Enzyme family)
MSAGLGQTTFRQVRMSISRLGNGVLSESSFRISATDWAQGPEQENGEWKQWGIEQSKLLTKELERIGVDLIDCSTGGNWVKQKITVGPGYQVPYAQALKQTFPNLPIGSVGMITEPKQANAIISEGKADVVLLAREAIRDPHFPMRAANELGAAIKPANEYERGWAKMLTPHHEEHEQGAIERGREQGSTHECTAKDAKH